MSINYGDTGIKVNYLQYFLKDNYVNTAKMTWVYDEYTHKKLLEYLDTPNSEDPEELVNKLGEIEFTGTLDSITQVMAKPFQAMQHHIEDDTIVFIMKNPNTIEGYNKDLDKNKEIRYKVLVPILKTLYNQVLDLVEKNGWRIVEYPDMYNDVNTSKIIETKIIDIKSVIVVLKKKIPNNLFPNFDIRYMVNYFNNDYVNNYMVSNNFFQKSSNYRVGLVKCNPKDRFIISHSYTYSIPIKIGYCKDTMSEVIDKLYMSTNLTSIEINGMNTTEINKVMPGVPILVEVPEVPKSSEDDKDYQTLVILIPNLKYIKQSNVQTQTPLSFIDTGYIVGDLNNDGVVDEIDRLIYACQRPKDMGKDEFYYFNQDYDKFEQLCICVKEKYESLFLTNVNTDPAYSWNNIQYNNESLTYTDSQGNEKYNIDTLVKHIRFLCSGSDIEFTRYIINGVINYKITIGKNQSAINMSVLSNYNSGNGLTVSNFDAYLAGVSGETGIDSVLNKYLYESNGEYIRSNTPNQTGLRLICGVNMSSNNLLVIKTNPDDNIEDCSKILNGVHNSEDGTLTLPIKDFKDNPWMVRDEIFTALLDMMVNPYSNQEDINYVFSLIGEQNGTGDEYTAFNPPELYIYNDELKKYIKDIQILHKSPFSFGYFDMTAYSVLYDLAYNRYLERQVEDGENNG